MISKVKSRPALTKAPWIIPMTFDLPLKRETGREGESLALLQRRQAHSIIKDIELNLCYQNQKVRRRKGKDIEWKDQ